MRYKKFEDMSSGTIRKSRTDLMAECLKLGLPVRIDDTYRTLELFITLSKEKEGLFVEDDTGARRKQKFSFKKSLKTFFAGVKEFLK